MRVGALVFGLGVVGVGILLVVLAHKEKFVCAKAEVLFSDCTESTCVIGLEFADESGISHVQRANAGGSMEGTTYVMYNPEQLSDLRIASFMDRYGKVIGIVCLAVGGAACVYSMF